MNLKALENLRNVLYRQRNDGNNGSQALAAQIADVERRILLRNRDLPLSKDLDDQCSKALVKMLGDEVLFRLKCRIEEEKKWWWFNRTDVATSFDMLQAAMNDSSKTTQERASTLRGAIGVLHGIDEDVYAGLFASVSCIAIHSGFWLAAPDEDVTLYSVSADPILKIRYEELNTVILKKEKELETWLALAESNKTKEQDFGFNRIPEYQNKTESEKRRFEHACLKREAPNFSLQLNVHAVEDFTQSDEDEQPPVVSTLFKDVKNAIANIYNDEKFNWVDGGEIEEEALKTQVLSHCNGWGRWSTEYKRVKKLLDAAEKDGLDDNLTAETLSRIDRLEKRKGSSAKENFINMKSAFQMARLQGNEAKMQEDLKSSPARVRFEDSLQKTANAYKKYKDHLAEVYELSPVAGSASAQGNGGNIFSLFGGARTSSKDNVAMSFMDRVREKVGDSRRLSSSGSENSSEKIADAECRAYRRNAGMFVTVKSIKDEAMRVAKVVLPTKKDDWKFAGEIADRNIAEYKQLSTDKRAIVLITLLELYSMQDETQANIRLLCQNVKAGVISYFQSTNSGPFSLDSLKELKTVGDSGNIFFTQIKTLFPAHKIDRNTGYIVKIREYAKSISDYEQGISGAVFQVRDKSYETIADLLLKNISQYSNRNRDVLAAFTLCQWYLTTPKAKLEFPDKAPAYYRCILARLETAVMQPGATFPIDILDDMPKTKDGSLGRLFAHVRAIAASGSNAVVQVNRSDSVASISVSAASAPVNSSQLFRTSSAKPASMPVSIAVKTKAETSSAAIYSQVNSDDEESPCDHLSSILNHEELLAAAGSELVTVNKTQSAPSLPVATFWSSRISFSKTQSSSALPVSAPQNNTSTHVDAKSTKLAENLLKHLTDFRNSYPCQNDEFGGALANRIAKQQNNENRIAQSIEAMIDVYLMGGLPVDLSQIEWPKSTSDAFDRLKNRVQASVPKLLVSASMAIKLK